MKKIICCILICSLLALAACGGEAGNVASEEPVSQNGEAQSPAAPVPETEEETETQGDGNTENNTDTGHVFSYKGVGISMNVPAADILTALGEAKSMTEEPSCAFEGTDRTYYYGSFYLQTYPGEDAEYTYCLWFADDTVTTAEGIYIGSTEEQVKQAYGEDAFDGSGAYVIMRGDSKLSIIMDGGTVIQITYDALVF